MQTGSNVASLARYPLEARQRPADQVGVAAWLLPLAVFYKRGILLAAPHLVVEQCTSSGDQPAMSPGPMGFRTVMVCLDRSPAAEAVLPLATYLAKIDNARLILVHVLEGPPVTGEVHATDALDCEIARQEARAYLETISARVAKLGVQVESRIAEGAVARGIAAMAVDLDADLIAVSRFGEGGRDEWDVGDIAQKILARARRTMVIVSPELDPAPRVPPRKILVPLDGSLRAESVLPTVLRLARPAEAEIVLAHVVPDPMRTAILDAPVDLALAQDLADRLVTRAQAYLERVATQLRHAGARAIGTVLRATDHREGTVTLAITHQIDLVVLAAHGAVCNPRSRFGSVTSHVIAHATAPVLVVQDLPTPTGHDDARDLARLPPRSSDASTGGI